MPPSIFALALATFAIGTTEFVIMGILPDVARSLSVSLPSAGMLVSGYALGVAAGAPMLALLTSRMPRKRALLFLLAIFIVGNVGCALAPNYIYLMIARVVTSFAHGAFFGIGSVLAASLVAPDRRASAIALMFTGLALANVLGVPIGSFIGHVSGWRATFWAVTAVGVAAMAAMVVLLPARDEHGAIDLRRELRVLANMQVWLALAMTVLGFGGVFVVFTYIAPILEQASSYTPAMISLALTVFGLGLSIGNVVGGKLADRGELRALLGILLALVVVMLLFTYTMHHRVMAAFTLFFWGITAFATVPCLQMQVLRQSAMAPNLAATLNIGAFNVGNALGAWLGGVTISSGAPLHVLPLVAAMMTVAAICVTVLAMRHDEQASALYGEPRAGKVD